MFGESAFVREPYRVEEIISALPAIAADELAS
jgi:hypothetical protein